MTEKTIFKLQFPASEMLALAARYEQKYGEADAVAFAAAQRIVKRTGAHGSETIVDLLAVMRWKSHRALGHLRGNSDEEIYEALDMALDTEHERSAIAVLDGLDGVGVAMASAIRTALQGDSEDERFTVIDVRALESLGVKTGSVTVGLYLEYLDEIFRIKEETGYSLRMIDRALWQWSYERALEPV